MRPGGRFVQSDLHRAGGVPRVMKELLDAGLLHGDCLTVTGKTIAENLRRHPSPRATTARSSTLPNRPLEPIGTMVVLQGQPGAGRLQS